MIIHATGLDGACLVEPSSSADDRGWFLELFEERTLAERGWDGHFVRSALSYNRQAGTLRGLHLQRPPHQDARLVTCVRGGMFDVLADVRPGSPTYGRWAGFELTADNKRLVFIPEGFAHGFQTLVDDTLVLYHISAYYTPDSGDGIRWDDPTLGISWPGPPVSISDQDRHWPFLRL